MITNCVLSQQSPSVYFRGSLTDEDGDHYVINGHKWWISGAIRPECSWALQKPHAGGHFEASVFVYLGAPIYGNPYAVLHNPSHPTNNYPFTISGCQKCLHVREFAHAVYHSPCVLLLKSWFVLGSTTASTSRKTMP